MREAILISIALIVVVLVVVGCSPQRASGAELLVDADWLRENIDDVILVDYGRTYEAFQAGHIPGAVYLDRSLFWTEVNGVAGNLPDPEELGIELGLRGIDHRSTVVVYDTGNGLWASRAFWGLEVLGHNAVRVLDGGIASWANAGGQLSDSEVQRDAVSFRVRLRSELLAEQGEILDSYESDAFVVVDARSEAEYSGADIRSNRGGHIPGAINIDWIENVSETGSFKSISQLASIYDATISKNDRVVTHCQTGVRGAHSYFVLRLLGYENVAVYDGSWEEWGNSPDNPIQVQ